MRPCSERSRVVIVGGGFGGLAGVCALRAAPVVARHSHVFMPFLCPSATATLKRFEAGCGAMASAFGVEPDQFEAGLAVGKRALLPTVRDAPADTLTLADGFSCGEQIRQATDRQTLHRAEVLRLAVRVERSGARA